MQLDRLLSEVDVIDRPANAESIDISAIAERLVDVVPGAMFCCVAGTNHDGHDDAGDAMAQGAACVLTERSLDMQAPQVRVVDTRAMLAPLAATFHGNPAAAMKTVGVTGTNGKTTVTHLMSDIFEHHDWKAGVIGTLSGHYTTPPALQLQSALADLRSEGVEAVALEVSSSGLVQHRADAITFDVAVFTNLTQDHLDYHGTMQSYFEAKSLLFEPGRSSVAIVNVDDSWGRQLFERLAIPAVEYSLKDAEGLQMSKAGSAFEWKGERVELPLAGEFNVMNALAAANAASALDIPVATIAEGLSKARPVPGRMELIQRGQDFAVIVDFAHTPDGLDNVLQTARSLVSQDGGAVTVVFGCGGDRDADKRPQMGAVAAALADRVVVTTDNARSEDPADIAEQIVAGTFGGAAGGAVSVELNRQTAIEHAVGNAAAGDVVVIAGKGHEAKQDIAGEKTPFDDRQVAAQAIDKTLERRTQVSTTGRERT